MKLTRILALVLLLTFAFGIAANAAVSDYPTVIWPQINFTSWSGEISVMITLEGVVGKKMDDGTVLVAEMPVTFISLYNDEEVKANEDGTFTVFSSDGDIIMTRDELLKYYTDDTVKLIPVVDGATLTIKNLTNSQFLDFYPGGYAFLDDEKSIMAVEMGQMGNYYSDTPTTFYLNKDSTDGMNDYAMEFPLSHLIIDGEGVSYAIITVSEEKAKELLATISEDDKQANENTEENEAAVEDTQDNEIAVEDKNESEGAIEDTVYTANPSNTKFELNGNPVSLEAYLIGNNNYVKLRDIAMAVNGTSKQFNVTWDQEKKAINMFSNTPYTPVGGEMAAGDGTSKTAEANVAKIYKDNEEITLVAYTIDGYNYFKLRDIAKVFDIGITWDGETLTAGIDTESSYVEE